MVSKINTCSPSFGMILKSAIQLANGRGEKYIDELIDSQKNNYKYNIGESIDYKTGTCFGVERHGQTIEQFKSLAAACAYATLAEAAAETNGAL